MAGDQPVKQRRMGPAQVQGAGGAGRETGAHLRRARRIGQIGEIDEIGKIGKTPYEMLLVYHNFPASARGFAGQPYNP